MAKGLVCIYDFCGIYIGIEYLLYEYALYSDFIEKISQFYLFDEVIFVILAL